MAAFFMYLKLTAEDAEARRGKKEISDVRFEISDSEFEIVSSVFLCVLCG